MLYPINLDIENIKITIIGGGKVAYRKATNFLDFGKKVTVISKEFVCEFDDTEYSVVHGTLASIGGWIRRMINQYIGEYLPVLEYLFSTGNPGLQKVGGVSIA